MKAVVINGPKKLAIDNIPEPVIGDYDVLCKTIACGICSGTDNHILSGHDFFIEGYPLVLGHEGIGEVVKLGSKVRHLNQGDKISRVFNKLPESCGYHLRNGALAEFTTATDWQAMKEDGIDESVWNEYMVHRVLPADMDPIMATMVITWRETLSFLYRVKPGSGDKVLIIGSGANALAFTEHLKNLSVNITVIGSLSRREAFLAAGAKEYHSYKEKHHEGERVSYDIILDVIGNCESANKVIHHLKKDGKIAIYGLDNLSSYSLNAAATNGDFKIYNGIEYDEAAAHDEVMKKMSSGQLDGNLYIKEDHIYPLENISDALNAAKVGKVFKSVIKF